MNVELDALALGATVSAVANIAMVALLTAALAVIWRLQRRLRVQDKAAIAQATAHAADVERWTVEFDQLADRLRVAGQELHDLMILNDELEHDVIELLAAKFEESPS